MQTQLIPSAIKVLRFIFFQDQSDNALIATSNEQIAPTLKERTENKDPIKEKEQGRGE